MLQPNFFEHRMSATDSSADYVVRIETLAKQLKDLGEEMTTSAIITKILCSLPTEYHHVITAWDAIPSEKRTVEELTTRLLNGEVLKQEWNSPKET